MSNWTGLLFPSFVVPSPFFPSAGDGRPDTRGLTVVRSAEVTLRNSGGLVYSLNFDPGMGWAAINVALPGEGPSSPYGLQPTLRTAPFSGVGYLGAPGTPASPTDPTFHVALEPTPAAGAPLTGNAPAFGGPSLISSAAGDGIGEQALPMSDTATQDPTVELVTKTRARALATADIPVACTNTSYRLLLGAYLWTPLNITSVQYRGRRIA